MVFHARIVGAMLVATGLTAGGSAQQRSESRPLPTRAIVDPRIVGTWLGNQHIFYPIRFEIGPTGLFKIGSEFGDGPRLPTIYVGEANEGRWTLRSAEGRGKPLEGTYRTLGADGLAIHGDYEAPAQKLVARPSPEARPVLSAEDVDTGPKLLDLLSTTTPEGRATAALRLAVLAKARPHEVAPAIPALIELLKDSSPDVRYGAALALGNVGANARAAALPLLSALDDEDPLPRRGAVLAIRRVVPAQSVVVDALMRALRDEHPYVRASAASELALMGDDAAPAAAALATAMADGSSWSRMAAATALKDLGRKVAAGAAPELARTLHTKDRDAACSAVDHLMWLGPEARGAVPELVEILRDRDVDRPRRVGAAAILGAIGPDAAAALPALTEVIDDSATPKTLHEAARKAREQVERDQR
jgi:HEAT repeat protein